ncbi:N-acetyltransferase [Actinorhabdospora filicis]|uniref:N-acetyltransferase n=1 Tax=Actinorhabdospora filicis TaxID=1785913 RepID=A0A9W6W7N7_9ACTN|nr:N-acetyltransferase [Actinorhabdospora filicis]GLZ76118.1 N-acetyltransferase [Actinorhabdospora filicis]
MDVRVRVATPADYPAAGRISVTAYREGGHFTGDAEFYAKKLADAETRATQCDLLVAVDAASQDVLGTVAYCPYGTPLTELCEEGEAEFRMLAVDPAAQGRGVGETLVRACVDRARDAGCRALVLCSRSDVAFAAIRLYERLGFTRTPEKDWSPAEGISLIGWRMEL